MSGKKAPRMNSREPSSPYWTTQLKRELGLPYEFVLEHYMFEEVETSQHREFLRWRGSTGAWHRLEVKHDDPSWIDMLKVSVRISTC